MGMRILKSSRKQRCVYWAPLDHGDFGRPALDDPIVLKVRWQDVNEAFVDPKGEQRLSRSKVFSGQDLAVGGYLWLFTGARTATDEQVLEVSPDNPVITATAADEHDAYEIRRADKLPIVNPKTEADYLRTNYL